ncbi:hypothetical protein SAY86_008504 [Trapa natans]|uniref:Uncharacterized protein n=1 Tax=Trapa natans TaxID=22666 RepID=A0AAN7QAT0_TRANT|nr:hypothetical protein SAY86_008504 [Trapa natans]
MITYITSASSISFISPPRYTEEKNPTPVDLAELAAMVDYSIEYDNSRSVILHLSTVLSNVDSNTEGSVAVVNRALVNVREIASTGSVATVNRSLVDVRDIIFTVVVVVLFTCNIINKSLLIEKSFVNP